MDTISFDLTKRMGKFKPLNAVNGGPWHKRHANDQWRSNMDDYKRARIPYTRNHDSNLAGSVYGGPYAVDITAIFPRFDADADDPASYDFPCTDESILVPLDAGTKTFFRLGQSIEHQIKKHGTIPPADFEKWARVCEHIIRHYNEGCANGFRLNIEYWEIWNEPDLDSDDSKNKRTWGGTRAQFFDLFEIAAKHLKGCFPGIKIGGPALCGDESWADAFLQEMKRRDVTLDFFSWHIYATDPRDISAKARRIRALLDRHGYEKSESILNEWNYVKGWTDEYVYSIECIGNHKGAAFTMACLSEGQAEPIDMMMYYDTRPSCFCGPFDYYTYRPRKPYYPLYWYGMFYDMAAEVRAQNRVDDVYTLCGVDDLGKVLAVVTYYTDDDCAPDKTVRLDFGRDASYSLFRLDERHDGEKCGVTDDLTLTLPRQSCVLIRQN